MKLVQSEVTYIPQGISLEQIYKQIEVASRVCYKSEDKITEDSAKKMVDNLTKNHHTAMLEHGTVYLHLGYSGGALGQAFVDKYKGNKYSKVELTYSWYGASGMDHQLERIDAYIVTNYRVIVENNWLDDLRYLCEPTEYHEKRYTFKFITSRAIANELVRHKLLCAA